MTRARLDGIGLLLLGAAVFLFLGVGLERVISTSMADFRAIYYPARCLIEHRDPYVQSEVQRIYQAEELNGHSETAKNRQIATENVYPPTGFFFTVPFAMLPWKAAHILWIALTIGGFLFGSFLVWDLGADYSPLLSGALVGFLLANSQLLITSGNAAGIVVSLCVVAVWCFFRERFVPAGIVCFAVSLAVKPHDSGLVWLFFFAAGGACRKRALQTLLVVLVLILPPVLFVWHVAPNWIGELRSNISAFSAPGGINDPGLSSTGGHGLDMLINLQTVTSAVWANPQIYNPASYLICAPLLVVWALASLGSHASPKKIWLSLAAISALSLLPIYHRQLDAALLLLTVPACAMLWTEGGSVGGLAVTLNIAVLVITGDLTWVVLLSLINRLHVSAFGPSGEILTAVQILSIPLALLVISIFYLWVRLRLTYTSKVALHNSGTYTER